MTLDDLFGRKNIDCSREEFMKPDYKDENKEVEYAKVDLTFAITKDEAEEIINNPRGQIARKMRDYVNKLIKKVAISMIEKDSEQT